MPILVKPLAQPALLSALVAALGGCAGDAAATLPPRPAVPADWVTLTTASGDLELSLPPDVEAFYAEESVVANSTPDADTGRLTFGLMAFGPWSVLDPPQAGETPERWIERVILSGVPQERRSATSSRTVLLPSGVAQLTSTTVDAGTADEERVMVWAVPAHGRIGYLIVNGAPEQMAGYQADIELIAALMRFARGSGPPPGPVPGG